MGASDLGACLAGPAVVGPYEGTARGFGPWLVLNYLCQPLRGQVKGETSATIIANKVGCAVAYVNVVKNELLRAQES